MGGLGTEKVNTGKGIPVLDFELTEISGNRCQITSIFSIEDINKSATGQVLVESEEGLEKSQKKFGKKLTTENLKTAEKLYKLYQNVSWGFHICPLNQQSVYATAEIKVQRIGTSYLQMQDRVSVP